MNLIMFETATTTSQQHTNDKTQIVFIFCSFEEMGHD